MILKKIFPLLFLCVLCVSGCAATAPTPTTGLTGTVSRGPITPVCRVDVPCDAPFSATFGVELGGKHLTDFHSDTDGHFTVFLAPGTYRITPAADAPLLAPSSQSKPVEVGASGLTTVQLQFDTGIR